MMTEWRKMDKKELLEKIGKLIENKKLNQFTGLQLFNQIKKLEHNLVLELQLIGEMKRAIRQEVMKNEGGRLEL